MGARSSGGGGAGFGRGASGGAASGGGNGNYSFSSPRKLQNALQKNGFPKGDANYLSKFLGTDFKVSQGADGYTTITRPNGSNAKMKFKNPTAFVNALSVGRK